MHLCQFNAVMVLEINVHDSSKGSLQKSCMKEALGPQTTLK